MADFREQINQARRAGYSDADIADFLRQRDPNVGKALESGYKPEEVLGYLAPEPTLVEQTARQAAIAARGAGPGALGATAGMLAGGAIGGPPGAALGGLTGSLAVPAADALTSAYYGLTGSRGRLPSEAIREMIPGPRAETRGERMVAAAGEAFGGATPQVLAGRGLAGVPGGLGAVGREVSRAPLAQIVSAPISGAVSTGVGEATGSPLAGLAAGVATGSVAGLGKTKRTPAPTAEQLKTSAKTSYDILDQSGFQMDAGQFAARMSQLPAQLRKDLGYVEAAYPKVTAAIKELQSNAPKDVAEIQALRKIIQGARNSSDAQERAIATQVLDDFDDYLLTAPPSAIVGGNKSAIQAWEQARQDYSRMKKGEIFDEIVRKSELATVGKESAMASAISALARNDKRMRLFSPEERTAIESVAKGGKVQDALRVLAKFTPMTPAAAIFTAVAPGGAALAIGGMTARQLATYRRQQDMNRLAEQMRLGRAPEIVRSSFADVPATASRGALSSLNILAPESVNALAP